PKGERIIFESGKFEVPSNPIVPLVYGDGIGPEITEASVRVINKALEKTYGERISWLEVYAGERAFRVYGDYLPSDTLKAIKHFRIALKGPLSTPVGGGFRSLNVSLRQKLDLYACVRPVSYIEGVPSRLTNPEELDLVIFRENTEDVYAGIEFEAFSDDAKKIIDFLKGMGANIPKDSGIGIKPMSERKTKRIARAAINYALENKRESVTIVHKGNIMKYTEGAFRKWCYEIAQEEFGDKVSMEGEPEIGKLIIKDRIADNMLQQLITRTSEYDVLVLPNLNGDYISDLAAALAGGLGMAPGANLNYEDGTGVFEATHGTAPKYTGLDKVNPSSLILSGAMMLQHIGFFKASELIRNAISETIKRKKVTYDLARHLKIKPLKTSEFVGEVLKNMD
ncbi:MAG: isocitrate dehydrogenase (NADP(+)), partial [Candidatus Methanofastidiosia archaeon]